MTDAAAEGVRRSLEGWKRSLRWVVALLAAVSLLALSYGPLLRALGRALVAEDPLRPAGAIVVLGGEIPFRAVEAAQLYRKKWAPRVVLTRGVDWEGQTKLKELGIEYPAYWEINREILLRLKVLQNAIVICEGGVAGTLEELRLVSRTLMPQSEPVILVTSKAHTRRVGLTWRYVTGNRPEGLVRAVRVDPFLPHEWWRHRRFSLELVREYLGLFNYWFGFPVPAPLPEASAASAKPRFQEDYKSSAEENLEPGTWNLEPGR